MKRMTSFPFLLAAFLLSVFGTADIAIGSQGWDYWIQKPAGWVENPADPAHELVTQIVEPGQNAFVEVYASKGQNPGLNAIADGWEASARQRGFPYVSNRLSSNMVSTVPTQGILREYTGVNNGIPIGSYIVYAYHNGAAFVVVGVYPQSMASQFKDLVYQTVTNLRFAPPGQTASAAQNLSNAVVGKWKWFNGGVADFQPNGTIGGNPQNTWQFTDPSTRTFTVIWNSGQWVDTLRLSADGSKLDGQNQYGNRVWGTRIGGDQAHHATVNLAQGKPARQSSIGWGGEARRAVDGNTNGNYWQDSVTHTQNEPNAWWEVDLGGVHQIEQIIVSNRTDSCSERLNYFLVLISSNPFPNRPVAANELGGGITYRQVKVAQATNYINLNQTFGRYVRIQLGGTNYLSLAEVQVMGK